MVAGRSKDFSLILMSSPWRTTDGGFRVNLNPHRSAGLLRTQDLGLRFAILTVSSRSHGYRSGAPPVSTEYWVPSASSPPRVTSEE